MNLPAGFDPALLLLIGLAQAGKDTAATLIMAEDARFLRVAFADPVREMALRLDPLVGGPGFCPYCGDAAMRLSGAVEVYGWEEAKKLPDVRRLLQRMGQHRRAEHRRGARIRPRPPAFEPGE